jgi:hypothetical protein
LIYFFLSKAKEFFFFLLFLNFNLSKFLFFFLILLFLHYKSSCRIISRTHIIFSVGVIFIIFYYFLIFSKSLLTLITHFSTHRPSIAKLYLFFNLKKKNINFLLFHSKKIIKSLLDNIFIFFISEFFFSILPPFYFHFLLI